MTDQYTPTTEQIELLVLAQLKQSAEKRGWPVDVEADRADFRVWLDQVKATSWDEGYKASDDEAYFNSTHGCTDNPYRKQENNE